MVVLEELVVADEPDVWRGLGFTVEADVAHVGGVALRLTGRTAAGGSGVAGWRLRGATTTDLDGLSTELSEVPPAGAPVTVEHANGALAVDHVVALTGDLDRTMGALAAAGLEPRRVREVPDRPVRQAFYVLGPSLLELAGPIEGREAAELWGLTVVVADLDALADRLGDRLGRPRDAVQPGRRIATLRREAGCAVPLAFMTRR